jgi:hypothetical protein
MILNILKKKSVLYNHLMPWTYERIQNEGYLFLTNLQAVLAKHSNPIAVKFSKQLHLILKEKNLNNEQKVEYWNKFIMSNWHDLEKTDIPLSLIVQITQKPFQPVYTKKLYEKVHLESDILENKLSAKKAIIGICKIYGPIHVKNAIESSLGVLNSTLDENFETDVD